MHKAMVLQVTAIALQDQTTPAVALFKGVKTQG